MTISQINARGRKMSANNRSGKVSINCLLWGLMALLWLSVAPNVSAQTYDFDEGLETLTKGLVSENRGILKKRKIAVFGIIESKSGSKWEISSHIEDRKANAQSARGGKECWAYTNFCFNAFEFC